MGSMTAIAFGQKDNRSRQDELKENERVAKAPTAIEPSKQLSIQQEGVEKIRKQAKAADAADLNRPGKSKGK